MSLIAWLPLTHDTIDYGSGSHTWATTGTVTYPAGKLGTSASFDASTYLTSDFEWNPQGPFSMCAWVKLDSTSTSSSRNTIIRSSTKYSPSLDATVDEIRFFCWKNSADTTSIISVKPGAAIGDWIHLAGIYDGTQYALYVNGVQAGVRAYSDPFYNSGVMQIATVSTLGYKFHGQINDVRIYDHCLSQKEIRELAKGLCLHYPMNSLNGLNCQPNMALTASMQTFSARWTTNTTVSQTTVYDSGTESGLAIKETVTTTVEGVTSGAGGFYWTYPNLIGDLGNLVSGETYTLSVSIRASRPVTMRGARSITESQTFVSSVPSGGYENIQLYTSYRRFSFTFKWTSTAKLTSCFYADIGATGDTVDVWIADPKLEKGSVATGYIPNILDSQYHDFDSTEVPDDSGMGNDSLTVGTLELSTDTPRYTTATKFTTGNYIYPVPDPISSATTAFSISVWIKTSATADSTIWTGRTTAGKGTAIFMVSNKIAFDDDARTSSKTAVNTGNWVHVVCTWTAGAKKRIYINGSLDVEATASASLTKSNIIGSIGQMSIDGVTSTNYPFNGMMSDFRIYATELSAADVSSLYRTSASMDNLGNLHTGEVAEVDGLGHQSMTRTGSVRIHAITEFMKQYDSKIYVEPDGSMWVRAFHHYAPIGNAFSTTDPFVTGVYGNDTRWFAMGICNYIDKWEIIYEHQPTINGAVSRFRWVQGTNPMSSDSTFDNTKNANITKYTTTEGYSAISSSYGGLYPGSVTNSYLRVNNNNSTNWYGAVGMCNTTWNNGQIPSYNNAGISTGYLDVYIRVDNVNLVGYPKSGFSMNRTDGSISTTGIIEL